MYYQYLRTSISRRYYKIRLFFLLKHSPQKHKHILKPTLFFVYGIPVIWYCENINFPNASSNNKRFYVNKISVLPEIKYM